MSTLLRLLSAAVAVELVAGVVGAATHSDWATAKPAAQAPGTSVPTTQVTLPGKSATSTTQPAAAAQPGVSSSYIASNLVDPTDMGGYYQVSATAAQTFLTSAPCLASLLPSSSQSGYGSEALLGPDEHSVPTFFEVVASYPSTSVNAVYRDVTSSIGSCSKLSFGFGGTRTSVSLKPGSIPPVGSADAVWSGSFSYEGSTMSLQIGVVEAGQTLVSLVWIDTVPASNAIMGNFTSTISLAIGKLA